MFRQPKASLWSWPFRGHPTIASSMRFGRSMKTVLSSLATLLFMVAVLSAAPLQKGKPEIFSISPAEGPAGTTIKVTGTGFDHTRYVLFSAGRTGQRAKFKVISDRELEVKAPPYFRPGTSATLVVVTTLAATVGVPASVLDVDQTHSGSDAGTFYHVLKNGYLKAPQGIVLIDEGGTAEAHEGAAICFVKNGGVLLDADRFRGLVIHEPRATLRTSARPHSVSGRLMQVAEISASIGIEPFVYYRPDAPPSLAESPPHVTSASPSRVPDGGLLTLHGKGFSETSEVRFISSRNFGNGRTAGFRIVSDKRLEVEVPENMVGNPLLVVVNPKGATLVAGRNEFVPYVGRHKRPWRPVAWKPRHQSLANPVLVVDANSVVDDGSGSRAFFIANGGRVAHSGGGCVFFVKDGGHLSVGGSGGQTVFHEPKADLADDVKGRSAQSIIEVQSLNVSLLSATFEVVSP